MRRHAGDRDGIDRQETPDRSEVAGAAVVYCVASVLVALLPGLLIGSTDQFCDSEDTSPLWFWCWLVAILNAPVFFGVTLGLTIRERNRTTTVMWIAFVVLVGALAFTTASLAAAGDRCD